MQRPAHREFMTTAIERDADAHRALLAGNGEDARAAFRAAADLYRRSWQEAPPGSYGRLVGMLKAAVLAGDATTEAVFARAQLADEDPVTASPTASYALALAALIQADDGDARRWSKEMAAGGDAFERTADAIVALSARDESAYADTLRSIVRDFEQRQGHLTGVAIADTALMLEQLAAARGMASGIESPLLPSI